MTAAKLKFDDHFSECGDALAIYKHLKASGYEASFGLRFIWIAAVSALDHYITELIIEIGTQKFDSGAPQCDKMLNETTSFQSATSFVGMNSVDSILHFRNCISVAIRYRSFQSAKNIADGLSFIWPETSKWDRLGAVLGISASVARSRLNAIVERRNLIAHNADFDDAAGVRMTADETDSEVVISYIPQLVEAIETCLAHDGIT